MLDTLFNKCLLNDYNNNALPAHAGVITYGIEYTNTGRAQHYTLTLDSGGDILGYYVYPNPEIALNDIAILNNYTDIEFIDY